MPFSDAIFAGTAPSVAAIVAGMYDELIANPRVALSYGQRWKDAVGLDTFTAARITDISKIASAAVGGGDVANSLARKLNGAVNDQLFAASSGLTLTEYMDSMRLMHDSVGTLTLGDTAGNVVLIVQAIAALTRRPSWIILDVIQDVAVVNQGITLYKGAAGVETIVQTIPSAIPSNSTIAYGTLTTAQGFLIMIPAGSWAIGERLSVSAFLSNGDGIADADLLRVRVYVFG